MDSAPRARDQDIIEDSLTGLQPITLPPSSPPFRGYLVENLLVSVLLCLGILSYIPPINLGLLYFLGFLLV